MLMHTINLLNFLITETFLQNLILQGEQIWRTDLWTPVETELKILLCPNCRMFWSYQSLFLQQDFQVDLIQGSSSLDAINGIFLIIFCHAFGRSRLLSLLTETAGLFLASTQKSEMNSSHTWNICWSPMFSQIKLEL